MEQPIRAQDVFLKSVPLTRDALSSSLEMGVFRPVSIRKESVRLVCKVLQSQDTLLSLFCPYSTRLAPTSSSIACPFDSEMLGAFIPFSILLGAVVAQRINSRRRPCDGFIVFCLSRSTSRRPRDYFQTPSLRCITSLLSSLEY